MRETLPLVLCALLSAGLPAVAQESAETASDEDPPSEFNRPRFGGPDQVDNQIANDQAATSRTIRERLLDPYFAWKEGLQEKHGLAFSVDYSAAYFKANESSGEDTAAGGMIRFFGSWDLVGRESGNTGAFVWKVEHRHAYTDVAPQGSASTSATSGCSSRRSAARVGDSPTSTGVSDGTRARSP